jgi:rhodanese-related sulfurtransferase
VCRHFEDLCPGVPGVDAAAPSKREQLLATMLDNLKNPYDSVRVADLAEELAHDDGILVLDVRPAGQFADAHMSTAVNMPLEELATRVAELPQDRDTPIVSVCAIGRTSKEATLYLKSLGYRRVRNLKGGITEWLRKGQSVEASPNKV